MIIAHQTGPVKNICTAIFKAQHAARTSRRANTTAHTGGAHNVLTFLGVSLHINTHFTIGRAIAATDALSAIGGNAETREVFL